MSRSRRQAAESLCGYLSLHWHSLRESPYRMRTMPCLLRDHARIRDGDTGELPGGTVGSITWPRRWGRSSSRATSLGKSYVEGQRVLITWDAKSVSVLTNNRGSIHETVTEISGSISRRNFIAGSVAAARAVTGSQPLSGPSQRLSSRHSTAAPTRSTIVRSTSIPSQPKRALSSLSNTARRMSG